MNNTAGYENILDFSSDVEPDGALSLLRIIKNKVVHFYFAWLSELMRQIFFCH